MESSLVVVAADVVLVVAVVVAEIEAVGVQLLKQLLPRCKWRMPLTFVYHVVGIPVSVTLVVYWGYLLLVGDVDCPFRDERRSRLESCVDPLAGAASPAPPLLLLLCLAAMALEAAEDGLRVSSSIKEISEMGRAKPLLDRYECME